MSEPITFITGNMHKVKYLQHWLKDIPISHHKLDLQEIQSLEPREVAEHKVREAFRILKQPVLVEDTSLTFAAMGRLPGTYIRWFLEEVGNDGLCKIAGALTSREAFATVTYAFYDGQDLHFFVGRVDGRIAPEPRGTNHMGWDPSFIPKGESKTFAEMSMEEITEYSPRAAAIRPLKKFLQEKGY
jgi:non-canonical purine NTP pyrophosphatase (RdgB/HAM1 family)